MFTARDIYNDICEVLMEPSGPSLGLFTERQILDRISDAVGNFARDAGLIVSMVGVQAIASTDTYTAPDSTSVTRLLMYNEQHVIPTSQFYLDNTAAGDWNLDGAGVPSAWAQDELDPKNFIVNPAPSLSGLGVTTSGYYGTLSSTTAGSDVSISAGGPFFGVISGDYTSAIYLAEDGYHLGTLSGFLQTNGNFLLFATAAPEVTYMDQIIEGVPDSFRHYIKYAVLEMIFSVDGELKDMQRQKYCKARSAEGINIAMAVQHERLLNADKQG